MELHQRDNTDIAMNGAEVKGKWVVEWALIYAQFDLPVYAAPRRTKSAYAGTNGFNDATTDPVAIEKMFAGARAYSNVGALMGGQWVCIDVDDREAAEPILMDLFGTTEPDTWTIEGSPRGYHLMFKTEEDVASFIVPGIDVKGRGSHVLMPPSVHPDGYEYSISKLAEPATLTPEQISKLYSYRSGGRPDVGLGDLVVDVDELRIKAHNKKLIKTGDSGGRYLQPDGSLDRSDAIFAVGRAMVTAGHSRDEIRAVLTDPENVLSERPRESLKAFEADLDRIMNKQDRADFGGGRKDLSKMQSNEGSMEWFDARYVISTHGGKTRVVQFAADSGPIEGELPHMTVRDFKDANLHLQTKKGKKAADKWLERPETRRVREIRCAPNQNPPSDIFNTWTGFAKEPKAGDWSLMEAHLREVVANGNEEEYLYLRRWLAWLVQHPDKPPKVALVMKSGKGAGKGTVGNTLVRIIGKRHSFHASTPDQLIGSFNGHLADKVFVFADEAFWGGDKKHEGALKSLITEPQLSFNQKYQAVRCDQNLIHLMIASNESWVIPATADERRFAVYELNDERASDHTYFDPLNKQMKEEGGDEAMLYDLLAMDLEGWRPWVDVPHSDALRDQIEVGMDNVDDLIETMLDDGKTPKGNYDLPSNFVNTEIFRRRLQVIEGENRNQNNRIGNRLRSIGGKKCKPRIGKERFNGWSLPPLVECRRKFNPRRDWPEDVTEWEA